MPPGSPALFRLLWGFCCGLLGLGRRNAWAYFLIRAETATLAVFPAHTHSNTARPTFGMEAIGSYEQLSG